MKAYFETRTGVVSYVDDTIQHLNLDLPWSMTISRAKSGVYAVSYATNMSLEDTDEKTST
jgi:hypothetical protein